MTDHLTHDAFLGGKVHIWQPKDGYRAGVDPVLLAASVDAKSGQTVLEIGCGVGTAALCLHARVPDLELTGIELQREYSALAHRNGDENNANLDIVCADLRELPIELRQKQFDHVIMNPPYFDRRAGNQSQNTGKDIAFAGETPLSDWLDVGIKRLAPKGYLTLIQRVERLADVIETVNKRLGSIVIKPIASRQARAANLFILQARQDGKAPLRLSTPLILHEGEAHDGDRESYTTQVKAILRNGNPLSLTD